MAELLVVAFIVCAITTAFWRNKKNEAEEIARKAIMYSKDFGNSKLRCVGFKNKGSMVNGTFFLMEEGAEKDPSKKLEHMDSVYDISEANNILSKMSCQVYAEWAEIPYGEFFSKRILAKKKLEEDYETEHDKKRACIISKCCNKDDLKAGICYKALLEDEDFCWKYYILVDNNPYFYYRPARFHLFSVCASEKTNGDDRMRRFLSYLLYDIPFENNEAIYIPEEIREGCITETSMFLLRNDL